MVVTDYVQTISGADVDVKFKIDGFHVIYERGEDKILFTSKTNVVAIVDSTSLEFDRIQDSIWNNSSV